MGDISVQRWTADIGNSGGTTTVTTVEDLERAFVINQANRFGNIGSGTGVLEADDLSGASKLTAVTTVTHSRVSGSSSGTLRFAGALWKWEGALTDPSGFRVRERVEVTVTAGNQTGSTTFTTPTDIAQVVPVINGIESTTTADGGDDQTGIAWCSGTNTVNVRRGGSGGDTTFYISLVEFGSDWTVLHGRETGINTDSATVTLVADEDGTTGSAVAYTSGTTMFFSQFCGDSTAGNEAISDNLFSATPGSGTGEVDIDFFSDHDASDQEVFVHAISHPDLNAYHITSTGNNSTGDNNIDISGTVTLPAAWATECCVVHTGRSSGSGTAYPAGWTTAQLSSTTNVVLRRERAGNGTPEVNLIVVDLTDIFGTAELDGASDGVATVTGTLTAEAGDVTTELAGTIAGTTGVGLHDLFVDEFDDQFEGFTELYVAAELEASPDGVGAVTGDLDAIAFLSGQSDGMALGSLTTRLDITAEMAGASAGVAGVTGSLDVTTNLAGSSDGVGSVTGEIDVALQLAASSAGAGAVTGALHVTTNLAGSSAGVGAVTGDIDVFKKLAGTSAGAGAVTGALTVETDLGGQSDGDGNVTGSLDVITKLAATPAGVGAVTGTLFNSQDIELAGTIAGTSMVGSDHYVDVYGDSYVSSGVKLTTIADLDGAAPVGVGAVSGTLAAEGSADLAGGSDGVGAVTGELEAIADLAGESDGVGSVTGDLDLIVDLAGSSAGVGAVTGSLDVISKAAGTSDGQGSVLGSLDVESKLAGSSDGVGAVTAALKQIICLVGSSAGVGGAQATVFGENNFAGSIAGVGSVSGDLTVTAELAGGSDGDSTVTGDAEALADLAGTTAGVGSVTAELEVAAGLSGGSDGQGGVTGQTDVVADLDGSTAGVGAVTGTLTVQAAGLQGGSDGESSVTGSLDVTSNIAGQSDGEGSVTGDLDAIAKLDGSSAGTTTIVASLGVIGQMAGGSDGQGSVTAELEITVNLAGQSDGVATVVGAATVPSTKGIITKLTDAILYGSNTLTDMVSHASSMDDSNAYGSNTLSDS